MDRAGELMLIPFSSCIDMLLVVQINKSWLAFSPLAPLYLCASEPFSSNGLNIKCKPTLLCVVEGISPSLVSAVMQCYS